MPWEHCGQQVLDDSTCPGCGITKQQWTVEWNRTRTFTVGAGASRLKLILQDADGDPIPNAAWEAELPDGTKLTGQLDAQGSGKIDTKGAKTCVVRFPQLPTSHWEAKQPQPGASS